ncbi:MAG: alpha/beta hydrolase [Bacteroidota bacterium]|nr:alpha/beta hydrolase [Bacteroidota bacterium]
MKQILLLHGAIGAKDQLLPLTELLKSEYRVHTINFSGHGGESMPEVFSIETFAKDVLNYLDANNIQQINVFGYSMGGYVALYLAKHHPERIQKIFTLATKFLWSPEIAEKETKMLQAEKIEAKVPAFAKVLETRHSPNDWKMVLQKTSTMMTSLGNKNSLSTKDYDQIEHEVLVALGDQDTMVTMEETQDVVSQLKNGSFLLMKDCPHPIEKVKLEKLTEAMNSFF